MAMKSEEYRVTEWWVCERCVAQWHVPTDFEERQDECPFCGFGSMSIVTGGDVRESRK